jgi:hypothetical protein
MAADQEWCLECGAARTVIARPPDWRVPILVIGIVVLLVAGGFAYAISRLGGNAGKVTVVSASPRAKPAAARTIYAWQPGLDGYTVILASTRSRAAADAEAEKLTAHSSDVGVLSSDQHPEMTRQGVWDVFEGRYASFALAKAAAAKAARAGEPQARPALVQRAGQG